VFNERMTYPKPGNHVGIAVCALVLLRFTSAQAAPDKATGTAGHGGAGAQNVAGPRGVAPADLEVLKTLHTANQLAIKLGKSAKDRAIMDAVKSFAVKVATDHAREDKKLGALLKKRGLRMSALGPVSIELPPEHAAYKTKTGSAYDHAFAAQMAVDYAKAIDLVERARKGTTDDTVRAYLDELLPTLQVQEASAKVLSDGKEPGQ
jgi:putative membrane protein